MSEHPLSEKLAKLNAPPPPPPPPETFGNGPDMGLATEVVFSGQRRRELRASADLAVHQPEASPTVQRPATRDIQASAPHETPEQYEQVDASDQRFALTTLILLSLVGLGILVILVMLMYQVILG